MSSSSFHILRVGIGITFLWVGILILRDPEAWGGLLQPWASGLIGGSLTQAMIGTAILDVTVGGLLLVNVFVWPAALLGALHLVIVLTTVGINAITFRDIGLLAATVALTVHTWPTWLRLRDRP